MICRQSKNLFFRAFVVAIILAFLPIATCYAGQQEETTETIIMVRHGEKPPDGLGQLSCKGLNRALALPDILLRRFGKPDYVFAPNPSDEIEEGETEYSYVRPLATIEPTAVRAGLPVSTQIGYTHIDELQKALTQPKYANDLIFVAWEHGYLQLFAQQFLKSYGEDPSIVYPWPGNDYDTIYIFKLKRQDGKASLEFRLSREDLNDKLSNACPADASEQEAQ